MIGFKLKLIATPLLARAQHAAKANTNSREKGPSLHYWIT